LVDWATASARWARAARGRTRRLNAARPAAAGTERTLPRLSPVQLSAICRTRAMENQSEAQARALEPTLGNAASPASRRAVLQLARLPSALKDYRLACYAQWDLGNLVRCVLAAGASANKRFGEDDTPMLCFAAQYGTARALKALVTGGADVRLADKHDQTALHWAVHEGHMPCVSLLLEAGAPLEAKNNVGHTPLGEAASAGQSEVVNILLERGANANSVTLDTGNTPLMEAVLVKHVGCVELLLPHSDLSITSKQGRNAFQVSVLRVLRLLQGAPAAHGRCGRAHGAKHERAEYAFQRDGGAPRLHKGAAQDAGEHAPAWRFANGARQRAVHTPASRCCSWPAELHRPAHWPSGGLQDGAC